MSEPTIARQITIKPIINYPRLAQVGQTYLLTIDLHSLTDPADWPYTGEEYAIRCLLDTLPLFSHEPVGEPVVVVHRFGGSYGPASFLLTAAAEETIGHIRVTLVNEWGLPVDVLDLVGIKITGQIMPYLGTGRYVITDDERSSMQSIINYYRKQSPHPLDETTLRRQITRYLTWMLDSYGTIELRGIKHGGEQQVVQLNLETVYVPLQAQTYRQTGTRQITPDQVLQLGQHIVITGGPGCGKTTVLLQLAWALARAITTDNPILVQSKLGLTEPLPLPIFVPLRAYATYIRQLPPGAPARQHTLATFISHYLIEKQSNLVLPADFFEYLLRDGQAVILLFDGLDEVPDEAERVWVRQAIEQLVTGRDTMRVVVTCRTVAYRERTALGKGFQEIRVPPLDDEHIEAMVRQAYGYIYHSDPTTARRKADELLRDIHDLEEARRRRLGDQVERLVSSPLLVRLLLVMHFSEHRLPEHRVELYMKATDAMLLPEYAPDEVIADQIGRLVGGSREVHRDLMQHLAFAMHNRGETKGREISEDDLRRVLGAEPAYAGLLDDFVALTRLRGTVLEERLGQYRFLHLAFQEYLAARYLAEVVRSDEKIVAFLCQDERLLDSWWREPALLVGGYLSVTSPQAAQTFLRQLAQVKGEPDIQAASLELAGTTLLEWPTAGEALKAEMAGRLAGLCQDKEIINRVTPLRRVAVGRVLGLLGDPREGVTTLPPLLTPPIEGEFLYGKKKEKRRLVPFRAGVYPVTNAQFAQFMATGGYENPAWWSKEGWQQRQEEEWTQPRYWDDSDWNNPNHPVVGVSWYEAEAFCRWLTATYGQEYRLPTEEQWERLARGQHGRMYPWGNDWEKGVANTIESGIGQTSAVGLFPGEVSPTGTYDCAGNVWQWCGDWYDKDGEDRVSRGGAFASRSQEARCVARQAGNPAEAQNDVGFRVVSWMRTSIVQTQMTREKVEEIVENILYELAAELVDSDEEVSTKIAETNALGFGLDTYEIKHTDFDVDSQEIHFEANLDISGDSDEDKPYCGDTVIVHILGTLKFIQNRWKLETYKIQSCKLNWP